MNHKLRYLFLLTCLPVLFFAQAKSKYKTFREIKEEKEKYFETQRKNYGSEYLEEEGSDYNEYKKWELFWEPRIGLNRTFEDYLQALKKNPYSGSAKVGAPGSTESYGNLDAWTELGPTDRPTSGLTTVGGGDRGVGPIQYITFYRPNPSIMLASSMAGGLFFSSNKGLNWTNAGSDYWTRSGCNSAAFSPSDPNTWYGCSNLGGQNNRNSIPNYGLAMGSFGGVYRTINAGLSYDLVGKVSDFYVEGALTTLLKIIIDPVDPAVGYVATSSGVYRSSNINSVSPSSVTWSLIHAGYIEDMELKTDNRAVIFITVKDAAGAWDIQYSTDAGSTWSSAPSQPSHTSTKNITIEVTEANSDLVYVLDRSTLGGNPATLYTYNYSSSAWLTKSVISSITMGGAHGFGVSNFNASVVYTAQGMNFYKSIDGGVNWIYISSTGASTMHHVDIEDLATPPATCASCTTDVWIATHGGVSFSSNACTTVQSRSTGLGVAEIFGFSNAAQDPEVIAMGLDHDGTVLSGGTYSNSWMPAWGTVYGGDGMPPLVDYSDTKYAWATAQASPYQLSQAYGQASSYSGTVFPYTNDWGNSMKQNQVFPNIVYVKGANNVGTAMWENMYRSSDRGILNIEQISDIQNINLLPSNAWIWGMYVAPKSANHMYIRVVANNVVYLLKNDQMMDASPATVQAAWKTVNLSCLPGGDFTSLAVDYVNPNIIYVTVNGTWGISQMIWKMDCTNPASPVCTDISDQSGVMPLSFVSNIVLEKGSNGGMYVSNDNGDVFYTNNAYLQMAPRRWVKMDVALPNIPISGLEINYKVNKLRIATSGRGVWEHDLFCPTDLFFHFTAPQTTSYFYEAVNEITSSSVLSATNSITYRAGTYIDLNDGFLTSPNSSNYFVAYIHPCSYYGNSMLRSATADDIDLNTEADDETTSANENLFGDFLYAYPNPTNGEVVITVGNSDGHDIFICDMLGQVIYSLPGYKGQTLTIDISGLSKGFYLLKSVSNGTVYSRRIIKE